MSRRVFADLVDISVTSVFFVLLLGFANRRAVTAAFLRYYSRFAVAIAAVGAIAGLAKFLLLTQGIHLSALMVDGRAYPIGTSLPIDYNVYSLGLFQGVLFLRWNRPGADTRIAFGRSIVAMTILAAIVLSGSRRLAIVTSMWILYVGIKWVIGHQESIRTGIYRLTLHKRTFWAFILVGIAFLIGVRVLDSVSYDAPAVQRIQRRATGIADVFRDDSAIDRVLEPRAIRIQAAFRILSDYSVADWIFGRGVRYRTEMAQRLGNRTGQDYPHNLFLSVLLSNGVLGLGYYFLMFFVLIRRAIGSAVWPISVYFVVLFLFSMTSGDQLLTSQVFLTGLAISLVYFSRRYVRFQSIRPRFVGSELSSPH
jgi:hypothetical protein